MEKCPLEDFNHFKKRKKEELEKEKKELDEALAFFNWLECLPDGGRLIYNINSPNSMLAFRRDIDSRLNPEWNSPDYRRREFAVEITPFLYYVYSAEFVKNDEEKWEFKVYQLPDKYADWKSPGY